MIQSNLENWNLYIAKRPNVKISFNELKNEFKSSIEESKELLEKEYSIALPKMDNKLLTEKVGYLKDNFNLEKSRQSSIDNKFTQIIGQSSIVIAIVAIIIPIIIDKLDFETKYIWLLVVLGIFSCLTIFYFTTSISISIKNLKTRGYYRPMHSHILYHPNSQLADFQSDQLVYLYNAINDNIKINDVKAEKVNKAYGRFTKGIFIFLISSAIGTFYICLNPKDDIKKISIDNQIYIAPIQRQIDSVNSNIIDWKLESFNGNN
ncbi:MAG: hypothetical protein ACWA6U_02075 [Breznakibacter sp.]